MVSHAEAASEIRKCEQLAQRVFNQCRDTLGPYRELRGNLKLLREVLEELRDALHERPTLGADLTVLAERALLCKAVLEKLDVALVSYKCSPQLRFNHEAVSKLEIQCIADQLEESSAICGRQDSGCSLNEMGSVASSRKSSFAATPSTVSSNHGTDVFMARQLKLPVCGSSSSLRTASSTPSWHSLFVLPDPLSVPIAEASRIILATELGIDNENMNPTSPSSMSNTSLNFSDARSHQDSDDDEPDGEPINASEARAHGENAHCSGVDEHIPEPEHSNATPIDGEVELLWSSVEGTRQDDASLGLLSLSVDFAEMLTAATAIDTTGSQALLGEDECEAIEHRVALNTSAVPADGETAHHVPAAPMRRPPPPPVPWPRRSGILGKNLNLLPNPEPTTSLANSDVTTGESSSWKCTNCSNHDVGSSSTCGEQAGAQPTPVQSRDPKPISEVQRFSFESEDSSHRKETIMDRHFKWLALEEARATDTCRSGSSQPNKISHRPGNCIETASKHESNPGTTEAVNPTKDGNAGHINPRSNELPARYGPWNREDRVKMQSETNSRTGVKEARPSRSKNTTPFFSQDESGTAVVINRTLQLRDLEGHYGVASWVDKSPTLALVDEERILAIVQLWNNRHWDDCEAHLREHLNCTALSKNPGCARRINHLLAVCASFRGEWDEAIRRFFGNLRKPINNLSKLDDGDRAAAYWLGDLFALQNKRADSLLAYTIAEPALSTPDRATRRSRRVLVAEQDGVQLGLSKSDFKERWTQNKTTPPRLLDDKVISQAAVKACLDDEHRRFLRDYDGPIRLEQDRTRASHLSGRDMHGLQLSLFERQSTMIAVESFDISTSWPLPCDPLFAMANVQRGRLLAYECDMLEVVNANPNIKLPRPLSLSKIDCFTFTDLPWLITTLRECLRALEMGYSEVVNVQGCWFVARYSFMQQKIATTHYFLISLFRHPIRSGHFGVEVCSDEGMCSARLVQSDHKHVKGVHYLEPKRLRKIIRQHLEAAKAEMNGAAPPVPPKPYAFVG